MVEKKYGLENWSKKVWSTKIRMLLEKICQTVVQYSTRVLSVKALAVMCTSHILQFRLNIFAFVEYHTPKYPSEINSLIQ